jgi:hypothetical protein
MKAYFKYEVPKEIKDGDCFVGAHSSVAQAWYIGGAKGKRDRNYPSFPSLPQSPHGSTVAHLLPQLPRSTAPLLFKTPHPSYR